jgi:hypothetical protein
MSRDITRVRFGIFVSRVSQVRQLPHQGCYVGEVREAVRDRRNDDDPDCRHDFVFGSQRHIGYSDNALTKMQAAMETVDMQAV